MIDFLIDFACKMKPKIEPEIDKIRALARLWAQVASKRAAIPHFEQFFSDMIRFWGRFGTILDDFCNHF